MVSSILISNFIIFTLLFILNFFIHNHFKEKIHPSASAGSIVMAIGIFSLVSLPQIVPNDLLIIKLLVLELLIVWLYIAFSYFTCYLQGNFVKYLIKNINDQFSIGTWVAGSAVLAILLSKELPELFILTYFISGITIIIWLIYLYLIIKIFFVTKIMPHTGIILLSTVSTQSIVIMNQSLSIHVTEIFNLILIFLGCLFYLIGIKAILSYHVVIRSKHFINEWAHGNSIIHGAVSITGLACLLSNTMLFNVSIYFWIIASCLLLPIESIGLLKLYCCSSIKYDISQWSRLFTLGMYYALSTSLYNNKILVNSFIFYINTIWPYLVLIILLIEIALFLKAKFSYNEVT